MVARDRDRVRDRVRDKRGKQLSDLICSKTKTTTQRHLEAVAATLTDSCT